MKALIYFCMTVLTVLLVVMVVVCVIAASQGQWAPALIGSTVPLIGFPVVTFVMWTARDF